MMGLKKTIFIGNRLNVLNELLSNKHIVLKKIYVQKKSMLHERLQDLSLPQGADVEVFSVNDKRKIVGDIASVDFDLLVSNGCPIILPVGTIRRPGQTFINVHPTLLPHLRGRTPLNGIFIHHHREIGATMHYMDDGIDTGNIIYQSKVPMTPDLDQGLIYKISFDLEGAAFKAGMNTLIKSDFAFSGTVQSTGGSYFNRTLEMQLIDIQSNSTQQIIDKIKAFGVKSQGAILIIGNKQYRLFAAEEICSTYLLNAYKKVPAGEIALEYDGKILLRTLNGIIKITSFIIEAPHSDR